MTSSASASRSAGGCLTTKLPFGSALEVVRSQRGDDHVQEAAQDPVLVEADDRVERLHDLRHELPDLELAVAADRIEARREELDERARDSGIRRQARLHVVL